MVLIPEGAIALGKLAQALIHGAKVLAIKGNFDAALELVKEIAANYPITLVNSLNPFRLEGQKTAAFEICERLGDLRITSASLWATPEISPLTGRDIRNIDKTEK